MDPRISSGPCGAWLGSVVLVLVSTWAPGWCVSEAHAGVVYRRVAFTGDPVPGEDEGTTFKWFYFPSTYETPSINDEGRALFSASVNTPAGSERA